MPRLGLSRASRLIGSSVVGDHCRIADAGCNHLAVVADCIHPADADCSHLVVGDCRTGAVVGSQRRLEQTVLRHSIGIAEEDEPRRKQVDWHRTVVDSRRIADDRTVLDRNRTAVGQSHIAGVDRIRFVLLLEADCRSGAAAGSHHPLVRKVPRHRPDIVVEVWRRIAVGHLVSDRRIQIAEVGCKCFGVVDYQIAFRCLLAYRTHRPMLRPSDVAVGDLRVVVVGYIRHLEPRCRGVLQRSVRPPPGGACHDRLGRSNGFQSLCYRPLVIWRLDAQELFRRSCVSWGTR